MNPSISDKDKLARSFGAVADSYEAARPGYPDDAAAWLIGGVSGFSGEPRSVLELGAGTGRLTQRLTSQRLVTTDPSHEMLTRLRDRMPHARALVARAEQIPMPSRTFDVIVAAQAFHWFDHPTALPEIARVLRPDGHLALVWNIPDESTPCVRKLQRIVPRPVSHDEDVVPLQETKYFGFIEEKRFRTWETVTRDSLQELVRSRSPYAVAGEEQRAQMLADVRALYDDYDRGPAGLQMPYVTHCYRARVQRQDSLFPRPPAPRPGQSARNRAGVPTTRPEPGQTTRGATPTGQPGVPKQTPPPDDDGTLLIDFH